MKSRIFGIFSLVLLLVATQLQAASYYGPTVKNDRLYRIAVSLKPSDQVSVGQTMIAIFKQNPDAFANNNINGLLSGSLLAVPTTADIAEVDSKYATGIITLHNNNKNKLMPSLASTKPIVANNIDETKFSSTDTPHGASEQRANYNNIQHLRGSSAEVESVTSVIPTSVALVTQENNNINMSERELYDFITKKIDIAISQRVREIGQKRTYSMSSGAISHLDESLERTSIPADIKTTTIPAINFDADATTNVAIEISAAASGTDFAAVKDKLNDLQTQLSSIIHILENNTDVFAVKDSLEAKFAETGSYAVSHYLSKSFDLNATYVINPYFEIGLALSIGLLLFGFVLESRSSNSRHATVDNEEMLDLDENEYDYIGSEEAIPAKLNLARAYCDMGLSDKARKVLTEITARGDTKQREIARNMLMDMDK
ncbi:MAG: hypothetical protein HON55_03645 [Legionellales bacterium]|jgi:FimV-like protein|nr:hypothetical protein [Legionellales bacterium]